MKPFIVRFKKKKLFQISYINFVLKNLAAQIPTEDVQKAHTSKACRPLVPPHLQCPRRSLVHSLSQ